jgi:hypothetical protein
LIQKAATRENDTTIVIVPFWDRPRGAAMATTVRQPVDPDVVRKFHFTREMIDGPVYRKYEKAIRKGWSVEDLDFAQDAKDWNRIDDDQRRGLLGVTVRFPRR